MEPAQLDNNLPMEILTITNHELKMIVRGKQDLAALPFTVIEDTIIAKDGHHKIWYSILLRRRPDGTTFKGNYMFISGSTPTFAPAEITLVEKGKISFDDLPLGIRKEEKEKEENDGGQESNIE